MMFGTAVMLFVVGAILFFAVSASIAGISLNTIGVILMIAGALSALVVLMPSRGRTTRRPGSEPPAY